MHKNQLCTSFGFWDLKVLIASLGMPDHAHLKSHYQFVALIDMYLHPKNQLYTSNSFWDIKSLKILQSDWLTAFLDLTREPDLQTCSFNRIIKVIMMHNLNPKHINGLFFCKFQKILVLGCFWELSPRWDFYPKIRLRQFFTLKAPWLHKKFQKNSMSCFWENALTYWHFDMLT